ncbi:holo-ACP synthase [Paucilactobacillus suebicus]|uniref:Holo-[acyl-carrier-protein] synthase n=1 Tax=Paucilactobacillus suebicus DSM 5007 = KCTC 3549 TaxID=1423807 RepID=A0A0R1VVY2_9LACO|nr:holo-ACP synthase [Paucilactobacillus suebicus]KRM09751.1 4-phosphopantetheinyl transferase [Paucilactobacillus suebicus DSM 5007 = KCTC 3549]
MIYGTGIDLTEIDRIHQMQINHPRLVEKVLTSKEKQQYESRIGQARDEYLAGRFSLKESFSKALGTGIGSHFSFQDVSFIDNAAGKPIAEQSIFDGAVHVSVSHTKSLVMTQVILERKTN